MSTETMQFRTHSGHAKLAHSEHFPGVEGEREGEREKTGRIAVTASRPGRRAHDGDEGTEVGA